MPENSQGAPLIKTGSIMGVNISTSGGSFHLGDETNIADFSGGQLTVQGATINLSIQNANGALLELDKGVQDLRSQLLSQYEERIAALKEQITDKQDKIVLLQDKQATEKLQYETELGKLQTALATAVNEQQQKENQFQQFLELIQFVDASNTSENYKEALGHFINGRQEQAMLLLDDARADAELQKAAELEDKSREIAKKLEEAKAEATEAKKKIAYEKFLKAHFLSVNGKFSAAEIYYKQAVGIFSDHLTNRLYGMFLLSQNRLQEALDYFDNSVELATSEAEKVKTLALLGLTLVDMNEISNAQDKLTKAGALFQQLTDTDDIEITLARVQVRLGQAIVAANNYQITDAISLTEAALAVLDGMNESEDRKALRALCLINLGAFYAGNLQLEDAIATTRQYQDTYKDLPDSTGIAPGIVLGLVTSYNNLGKYFAVQEQFDAARQSFEDGISLCMKFLEQFPLMLSKYAALLHVNLGKLLTDNYAGRQTEAKQSLELAVQYKNASIGTDYEAIKLNAAEAWIYLARIAIAEGDTKVAEAYFQDCFRLIDNKPAELLLALSLFSRNVYYYYGEFLYVKEGLAAASVYWEKCIDVYRNLPPETSQGVAELLVLSYLNVGRAYQSTVGDAATALKYYASAFEVDAGYGVVYARSGITLLVQCAAELLGQCTPQGEAEKMLSLMARLETILSPYPDLLDSYTWPIAQAKSDAAAIFYQRGEYEEAEKTYDIAYDMMRPFVESNTAVYEPLSILLFERAGLNYLMLGDQYINTDKELSRQKYSDGVQCLHKASQLIAAYPEHPDAVRLKPEVDLMLSRLEQLAAEAELLAASNSPA